MGDVTLPEVVRNAYRRLEQSLAGSQTTEMAAATRSWQALEVNPRNLDALGQLVTQAAEAGLYGVAETFIRYALTFHAESPQLSFALGMVLKARGDMNGALTALLSSLERTPDNEAAYVEVAYVYLALGRLAEQKAWLKEALEKYPDNDRLLVLMGEAVKRSGDSVTALDYFRRALKQASADSYIYQTLAHTKKFEHHDDDIVAMEALLNSEDRPVADQTRLCFALGKAYEDIADFASSFAYYARGNRLVRAGNGYDHEVSVRKFAAIEQAFDETLFQRFAGRGCDSDIPIFIVSMPRSGSTLVEKMLAAHAQVFGAGELALMSTIVASLWGKYVTPAGTKFPAAVASLSGDVLRDAGHYYVNEVKKLAGDKKIVRITDKMPHNFLYVGLIKLLLPKAKIIHCRREPMDTCLSCFRHHFSGVQDYAYDLQELGQYYRLYQGLMAHWNRLLPGWLLDVEYEELVRDQPGQLKRILEFCELPWDEASLRFHEAKHEALTASSVQVTKPLYSSAVGYWRNYAPYLEPLRTALAGQYDGPGL
jgi:tetratricopeptide (TPR) repeat protein